jgi:hypothetical protein
MEASLLSWCEFKVKKLELVRAQYEAQMKILAEEISDIDYEVHLLKDAMMEGSFMNPQ